MAMVIISIEKKHPLRPKICSGRRPYLSMNIVANTAMKARVAAVPTEPY